MGKEMVMGLSISWGLNDPWEGVWGKGGAARVEVEKEVEVGGRPQLYRTHCLFGSIEKSWKDSSRKKKRGKERRLRAQHESLASNEEKKKGSKKGGKHEERSSRKCSLYSSREVKGKRGRKSDTKEKRGGRKGSPFRKAGPLRHEVSPKGRKEKVGTGGLRKKKFAKRFSIIS